MGQKSIRQDSEFAYFDSLQFSKKARKAFHAFYGRQGGVSKGVYNSLNCGRGSDDNPANVRNNIEIIAKQAGIKDTDIATMHQVHGDVCLYVEKAWPAGDKPKADAIVTDKAGIALGVLTADCAPVLLYGEKQDGSAVIGAAHAGWKGAVGGILDSVVATMKEKGAVRISGVIGPCISQVSYEVNKEFFHAFEKENPDNEHFFKSSTKAGHLMFDLPGYCASKLARLGLSNVFIKDLDTYFNEEEFFSYRRATHRGEKDYGRQMSLIYIKE